LNPCCADPKADPLFQLLAEQALSGAGGAPLVPGNNARIMKDAEGHFSLFLDAIGRARHSIFRELHIRRRSRRTRVLCSARRERPSRREGSRDLRLARKLSPAPVVLAAAREGRGEVRWFNPPDVSGPLAWFTRDHRKILVTDGQVAFVTGLCISSKWLGDRERGVEPWRDTGIAIGGPAVADIEAAFGQTWAATGAGLAQSELRPREEIAEAGDVALRVLPATPAVARL